MLKGFELGADDYVTKPFPISVFRKKVSALLAHIQKADWRRLLYGRYAVHQFFGTDRRSRRRTDYFHANGIPLAKGVGEKSADRFDKTGAS